MTDIRQLLVPTDFGEHATAAVRFASLLARRFGASVALLHATEFRPSSVPVAVDGTVVQTYADHDRLVLGALERAREQHLPGITTTLHVADGTPAAAILDHARRTAADMIVTGTRGRHGVARALFGSVAEEVMRGSEVPVLTVRDAAPRAVSRVLCAMNDSAAAETMFRHAVLFASTFGAELIALPFASAAQLNQYAAAHAIDLIVAAGTTYALTRHAPCPVLTVGPAAAQLAAAA